MIRHSSQISPRIRHDLTVGHSLKPLIQLLCADHAPFVEWIDVELRVGRGRADEKMAGEANAVDVDTCATGNLHVDDAQQDGQAAALLEHGVETGVSRIEIMLAVTAELELNEHMLIQTGDLLG